jgi:hypothetical protein
VIGLEDRLRTVEGVASIRVELGEEGVDAIKVEVLPDADEAGVLEEIRQVLVAYGLRSRKPGWKLGSRRTPPAIVAEVADIPAAGPAPGGGTCSISATVGLPPIGESHASRHRGSARCDAPGRADRRYARRLRR